MKSELFWVGLTLAMLVSITGCGGPAQNTANDIGNAAQNTTNAVGNTVNNTTNAIQNTTNTSK